MGTNALHSVSVAAVITNEADEVLLIHRHDNGHLEPPGGVLELHESIPDGLRREVREETGLEIEPVRLTGVYKNLTRGVVALVFRVRTIGGHVLPSGPETAAVEWVAADAVTGRCTEAYAVRITDALQLEGVAVRVHDGTRLLIDNPTNQA